MARLVTPTTLLSVLLLAALLPSAAHASLAARNRFGAIPQGTPAPSAAGFGSYVTTCNATHVTFLNFARQSCRGSYTAFSSPLNQCGPEQILGHNFSWDATCDGVHATYNNFPQPGCGTAPMLSRVYNVGSCYDCPNAECKDGDVAPPNNFGPLRTNLPWMENQWHVAPGVTLASGFNNGVVYKVMYQAFSDCVSETGCQSTIQEWLGGFKAVAGLTFDAASRNATVIAVSNDAEEVNMLVQFSVDTPGVYQAVAVVPAQFGLLGNLSLNGLAAHESAKTVFYATNLANFSAGAGSVFAIDVATGRFTQFDSGLTAADGAFVFENVLYVSEVFAAVVHRYNVTEPMRPVKLGSYAAPGLHSLDDFFVTSLNGVTVVVGADFVSGTVGLWNADGTGDSRILAAGLDHPTSVRPELSASGVWATDYVTVTTAGEYPATGRGNNGGNVYRLRVKNLPPAIKSPGNFVQISCPNSNCGGDQCFTAFTSEIGSCAQTGPNSSVQYTCNLLSWSKLSYSTPDCSGTATSAHDGVNILCSADGSVSTFSVCAKL